METGIEESFMGFLWQVWAGEFKTELETPSLALGAPGDVDYER